MRVLRAERQEVLQVVEVDARLQRRQRIMEEQRLRRRIMEERHRPRRITAEPRQLREQRRREVGEQLPLLLRKQTEVVLPPRDGQRQLLVIPHEVGEVTDQHH